MVGRTEKYRRAELKRKLELRPYGAAWTVVPGHRGIGYPVAHACFACRKSFKMKVGHDTRRAVKCPQCTQPLAWMGRTFKAPRKDDIRQWKKVEALWNAGIRFHTYHSPERLPDTLAEVPAFLKRRHQAQLLRFRR